MTEKKEVPEREVPERRDAEIDYKLEGADPGNEQLSETDRGYDEAARSGPSRYAVPEGAGGVFGTTGGGTYGEGFQVEERPGVYDRSGEPEEKEERRTIQRDEAESGHDRT